MRIWVVGLGSILSSVLGVAACGSNGAADTSDSSSDSNSDSNSDSDSADSDSNDSDDGSPPPSLGECEIFPASSPWNQDVSGLPVHPLSDAYVDSIGREARVHPDFGTEWEGAPIGIPYVVVDSSQEPVPIDFTAYGDESDPGPYPIPLDAPIEGGPSSDGDRHVIAVDTSTCRLYELYRAFPQGDRWEADSAAEYDLTRDDRHPAGCTSADAAGLPIFPGLVRYDEVVEQGELRHAVRFTVSRSQRAYVAPASHYASSDTDPNLPPMGLRLRMKADYDCSGFSEEARVVCAGLKKYGLILADNGSNWYLSGAPDPRWDDDALGDLKTIIGDAFEAVDTGAELITDAPDCVIP